VGPDRRTSDRSSAGGGHVSGVAVMRDGQSSLLGGLCLAVPIDGHDQLRWAQPTLQHVTALMWRAIPRRALRRASR
jgi:hypothetical protein